jgi:hypothetical protein
MRFTFYDEDRAFYFYFTEIPPGGIKETFPDVLIDVNLNEANQIAGFSVLDRDEDGERFAWEDKVGHIGKGHLDRGSIRYEFPSFMPTRTIRETCNVDVGKNDQVVGVEILFVEGVLPPKKQPQVS